MIFSSLTFLFYYLPLVLAVYFLVAPAWRNAVLLVVSLLLAIPVTMLFSAVHRRTHLDD